VGQRLGVGAGDGAEDDVALVALEQILRYERPVDFVDPPHTAKVRLTGEGVGRLERGSVITVVADQCD
jgi:hypothetical protein